MKIPALPHEVILGRGVAAAPVAPLPTGGTDVPTAALDTKAPRSRRRSGATTATRSIVDASLERALTLLERDLQEVLTLARAAADMAGACRYRAGVAQAQLVMGHAYAQICDAQAALRAYEAALAHGRRTRSRLLTQRALLGVARALELVGDFGAAFNAYNSFMQAVRADDPPLKMAAALINAGIALMSMDRHTEAIEHFIRARAVAPETRISAQVNLTIAYGALGRVAEAQLELRNLLSERASAAAPVVTAIAVAHFAETLVKAGQAQRARRYATQALAMVEQINPSQAKYIALGALAQLELLSHNSAAACRYARARLALAEQMRAPEFVRDALRLLSRCHAARGHWRAAYSALEDWAAAEQVAVRRKIDVVTGYSATRFGLYRHVQDSVTDLQRDPVATPWEANLTARQMSVLRLMAQGRTNKEIARDLGLSPYTVRQHVSEVLDRLGARTRTEAVALATQGRSRSARAASRR